MTTTYITTYDANEASAAHKQANKRLESRGFSPRPMQSFQKPCSDGLGDRFTITLSDGVPTSVIRDFDPRFG